MQYLVPNLALFVQHAYTKNPTEVEAVASFNNLHAFHEWT